METAVQCFCMSNTVLTGFSGDGNSIYNIYFIYSKKFFKCISSFIFIIFFWLQSWISLFFVFDSVVCHSFFTPNHYHIISSMHCRIHIITQAASSFRSARILKRIQKRDLLSRRFQWKTTDEWCSEKVWKERNNNNNKWKESWRLEDLLSLKLQWETIS